MGVNIARPMGRNPRAPKTVRPQSAAERKFRIPMSAAVAVGLWFMLWSGYNTGLWFVQDPDFPTSPMQLIHGLRAFAPLAAGWVSLLLIMGRPERIGQWILGPLGWLVFFAVVGLATSALVSVEPGDAIYWGAMYLSILLVLLAIVRVANPLPDLRRVMEFNWIVDCLITLSLLGALPFMGKQFMAQDPGSEVGVRAYGAGYNKLDMLGMAATRNTGFARFAAVAAIVALARIWDGKPRKRLIWAAMLLMSLYALVLSNGRTEILAFIASASLVLALLKKKRTVLILIGVGAAALLGLAGFYGKFFKYITRSGHMDNSVTSMSGRTNTWEAGMKLFLQSPIWGFGFQADRYYLHQHMHNAFLHVFVEAGALGGAAVIMALIIVWLLTVKHFFLNPPRDRSLIPAEIPGVLLFITISSITESTFAYFSAAWLLCAPAICYILTLDRQMRKSRLLAELQQRYRRSPLARLRSRAARSRGLPDPAPPAPAGGTSR